MNQQVPELNAWSLAAVAFFGTCALASLAMWLWAIIKLLRREPLLLPDDEAIASGETLMSDAVVERDLVIPAKPAAGAKLLAWRGATVLAIIGLYFALQVGVGGIYAVATHAERAAGRKPSPAEQLPVLIYLQTVINLAIIVLAPVVIRWTSGHTLRDLGLRLSARMGRDLRVGVAAFLLVGPVVYTTFALSQRMWATQEHPIQKSIRDQGASATAGLALISAAIAAPVAEEILFRGVLLGWLTTAAHSVWLLRQQRAAEVFNRTAVGDQTVLVLEYDDLNPPSGQIPSVIAPSSTAFWLANCLTSLVFAGLHYEQWPAPVALFFLSMVLGWLVYRTGRLMASIVLHATFNSFSTILMLLMTQAFPNIGK